MIPLRLAAAAATPHMGLLVWIFGSGRYVPQNYQAFQIRDEQLAGASYQQLIDKAVSRANGHAFATEYAQPTNTFFAGSSPTLKELQQKYSYVTRLYTRISPEQMTLDPTFAAQSGLPDVSRYHSIPAPNTCNSFNLWLGSLGTALGPAFYPVTCLGILVPIVLIGGGIALARRKKASLN